MTDQKKYGTREGSMEVPSLDKDLAENIEIGITQAAKLTGVKMGTIQYWTDKGYIKGDVSKKNGKYIYNLRDIQKMKLISQLHEPNKNDVFTLKFAAKKADEILEAENNSGIQALLLIYDKSFEEKLDKLAKKLTKAGLADQIIEALKEDDQEDG